MSGEGVRESGERVADANLAMIVATTANVAMDAMDAVPEVVEIDLSDKDTARIAAMNHATLEQVGKAFCGGKGYTGESPTGWHSVALSSDGKTLVLDRRSDLTQLIPELEARRKATSGEVSFHVFHLGAAA